MNVAAHRQLSREEQIRLAKVDEAATRLHQMEPPPPQVPVPEYGAPQRDAIASLVDKHVQDVCSRIDALIKQLDAMKQQVLVGSASTKQVLNEHIGICLAVNEETDRISDVIDVLAQKALRM